jgi:hypothetical protein
VCSIALTGPLDADTAQRLRARLGELMLRGCDRLIIDVSAAGELGEEGVVLLATVFESHPPSCAVVVVGMRRTGLADLLPPGGAFARSLSDARWMLGSDPRQLEARKRPAPGDASSAAERHALAVRQALRWAEQSAGKGDYEGALEALATIERVEGPLPQRWQEHRQAWWLASHEKQRIPRARARRGLRQRIARRA